LAWGGGDEASLPARQHPYELSGTPAPSHKDKHGVAPMRESMFTKLGVTTRAEAVSAA
jgi:hypothetical protein